MLFICGIINSASKYIFVDCATLLIAQSNPLYVVMLLCCGQILPKPTHIVDKSVMIEDEFYKINIIIPITSHVEQKMYKKCVMHCSHNTLV